MLAACPPRCPPLHAAKDAMNYPNVKNAHVVPRTYLANWAVDGKIATWLVPEGKRLVDQPIENVGTRRRFYARERPGTGDRIDDVEWSLGRGEHAATPLLRSFAERWPLTLDEKTKLAELFAYQVLRGPRAKASYEQATRAFLAEWAEQHDAEDDPTADATLLSNSYRLTRMFATALTLTSVFGSMHWTLVEFERPLIATCDEPVVVWGGGDSEPPRVFEIRSSGVLSCIEVRLPLSPRQAVLMTWADKADDEDARVAGTRDHALNFNAFTAAAADRQWFHQPGPRPPIGSGRLLPLSTQIVRGYTPEAATASRRRQRAAEIANRKLGRELDDREIEVVTMTRGDA
jgi:Protein of unknown function (DUF4238)